MKFSMHYGALGLDTRFDQGFAFAAECGLQGVELVMKDDSPLPPDTSPNRARELRRMAEDAGLCISGLSNACLWSHPLTANDESSRRRGWDSLLRQIELAGELGAKRLLVIPGYAGTDYISSAEKVPYDIAMERVKEGLAFALPAAEQLGVCLCVENVWNRLLLSPLELAALVDGFDSQALGLYFDVGNAMLYGDPELWIPLLNQRIRAVHIKDVLRSRADASAHTLLGQGHVPFPAVRAALNDIGYQDWLTLEVHLTLPRQVLKAQIACMQQMMA